MSRPYSCARLRAFLGFTVLLLAAVCPAQISDKTQEKPARNAAKPVASAANVSGFKLSLADPLTRVGVQKQYELDFEPAIAAFERVLQQHPDDPFAVNHLLQAVLLQELYRLNALDTTLYADNGFLTGKPLNGDPQVKARINELAERAIKLCEARLKQDSQDVDAYYARGVTRGLRLSYVAIVEKSFWSAIRNASASRGDHERVLELDPTYTDAKLVVGVHNFVVGSMPLAARFIAGIVGVGGNKKKGLEYLREVAGSQAETSADARVALTLFLRREGKYDEALAIQRSLRAQYPRNFMFALEEANLLKDAGRSVDAAQAYAQVLENCKAAIYPDPHTERAAFGLAEVLKGAKKPEEALAYYRQTLAFPDIPSDLRIRAELGAGQMQDALLKRDDALKSYRAVIVIDGDSPHASAARRYLKQPFRYDN